MVRIKQLSHDQAQKIAAGEVVERPANVAKELIENALDAGATAITLYIQDAGKVLIRVVDNGCGMSSEDARLCFLHHATSKITSVDDLPSLATFGFRGEALSSICSVSKVTLLTKEEHAQTATHLVVENATIIAQTQVAGNSGTDITIADLFYTIPARKKFLKTNDTEWRHILLLFQSFCLAHPQVHFRLFSQGNELFNCPGTDALSQRVAQLWDHSIAQKIIPVTFQNEEVAIRGIISNHTYGRYDRSCLFFFVNNRWVKNYTLAKALLKGYANVLPADKFPLCALSIRINPALIDVNIHPRKEEIQFLHPRLVETAIQTVVRTSLQDHLSVQIQKPISFSSSSYSVTPINIPISLPSFTAQKTNVTPPSEPLIAHTIPLAVQNMPIFTTTNQDQWKDCYIIGQLHKTYILIEQEDGLFIVDQHAAHESVLYERFSSRFTAIDTIQLLFPLTFTLNDEDMKLALYHRQFFEQHGITLERFGTHQIIIASVPLHIKDIHLEELVRNTLEWAREEKGLDSQQLYEVLTKKLHAQMACKAAIKAGDILTAAQMQQLLSDLDKTDQRFTCPHGRPTGWNISLTDIEKKFKRKSGIASF